MKIKKIVTFTSGVRHQICIQKNLLSKYNKIIKYLTTKKKTASGRNNTGRITVRHQGGGCKKNKHLITPIVNSYACVLKVNYNPISNNLVSLNFDLARKFFFKQITIKNTYAGSIIHFAERLNDFRLGYRSQLSSLYTGAVISLVESKLHSTYARSAGSFCQIIEKTLDSAKIKLPSGKVISIPIKKFVTLGQIGNSEIRRISVGKAGRNRLVGIRPTVRGIAMNPVDHPHGGKSNKGMPQVTPWGIPTKNKPTVKK